MEAAWGPLWKGAHAAQLHVQFKNGKGGGRSQELHAYRAWSELVRPILTRKRLMFKTVEYISAIVKVQIVACFELPVDILEPPLVQKKKNRAGSPPTLPDTSGSVRKLG